MRSLAAAWLATALAAPLPEQFHLALADENQMTISFKLALAAPQTCTYANLTSSPSTVRSYFPGRGFYHHVLLQDLTPSTLYTYTCAGGPALHFTSPPPPAVFTPLQLAVFGDWGYLGSAERGPSIPSGGLSANWSAVPVRTLMEDLKNNGSISMVLHTGDINYADDGFGEHPAEFTYENVTDGWFNWIQNVSGIMPYHVSVGNHESECHSPACLLDLAGIGLHENNFSAYKSRWSMNNAASRGVENMWYSVRRGGVHFVSIDTETDFKGAEESTMGDGHFPFLPAGGFGAPGQYMSWLAADLAAAAADPSVRWIIATGHRPFEDLPQEHAAALAQLFKAAGVAFYFCGHGHTYIRYAADAFGAGAVQIMAGGAGSDETPWPKDGGALGAAGAATAHVAARCQAWCSAFDARRSPQQAQQEPSACRFCASTLGATPVATSDLYSLGWLDIQHDAITFKLLHAPSGAVIDSTTVAHA